MLQGVSYNATFTLFPRKFKFLRFTRAKKHITTYGTSNSIIESVPQTNMRKYLKSANNSKTSVAIKVCIVVFNINLNQVLFLAFNL